MLKLWLSFSAAMKKNQLHYWEYTLLFIVKYKPFLIKYSVQDLRE